MNLNPIMPEQERLRAEINRIHQRPAMRPYKDIVDDLMQLIETHTAQAVREARIDELKHLRNPDVDSDIHYVDDKGRTYSILNRLNELTQERSEHHE